MNWLEDIVSWILKPTTSWKVTRTSREPTLPKSICLVTDGCQCPTKSWLDFCSMYAITQKFYEYVHSLIIFTIKEKSRERDVPSISFVLAHALMWSSFFRAQIILSPNTWRPPRVKVMKHGNSNTFTKKGSFDVCAFPVFYLFTAVHVVDAFDGSQGTICSIFEQGTCLW